MPDAVAAGAVLEASALRALDVSDTLTLVARSSAQPVPSVPLAEKSAGDARSVIPVGRGAEHRGAVQRLSRMAGDHGGGRMRRRDRAAARFVAILAGVGLLAGVLYFTGLGRTIRNVGMLAWRGNAMVSLARSTRFTPPAGGVAEPRLRAYLAVSERIKPFGDKIDAWEAAHRVPGRTFSFKGGAAGLVEAYLGEFSLALGQQGMGPAEFAWIEDRVRQATASAVAVPESDRVLFADYRDRLDAAALGPHALRIARDFRQ